MSFVSDLYHSQIEQYSVHNCVKASLESPGSGFVIVNLFYQELPLHCQLMKEVNY